MTATDTSAGGAGGGARQRRAAGARRPRPLPPGNDSRGRGVRPRRRQPPLRRRAGLGLAGSRRSTEWEPREALLAGPDGLDAIRALLSDRGRPFNRYPDERATAAAPVVALEVGEGQAGRSRRAAARSWLRHDRHASRPRRHRARRLGKQVTGIGGSGALVWLYDNNAPLRGAGWSFRSSATARRPRARRWSAASARAASPSSPPTGSTGSPATRSTPPRSRASTGLKGRDDGKSAAVMYLSPLAMRELVAGLGPRTREAVGALLPGPGHARRRQPGTPLPARLPRGSRAARGPPDRRAAGRRHVPALPDLGQPQRRAAAGPLRGRVGRDRRRRRPGDRRRRARRDFPRRWSTSPASTRAASGQFSARAPSPGPPWTRRLPRSSLSPDSTTRSCGETRQRFPAWAVGNVAWP